MGPSDTAFAKPWQDFLEEFGSAPLLHSPLENIYKGWEGILTRMMAQYEIPPPDTSVSTKDVTINEANKVWVRIYHPPKHNDNQKVGLYFHGGGWALGNVDLEDAVCRIISKSCEMVVVSVEYRLAPMHVYPAALDDCVEATKWVLQNGKEVGGNADEGVVLIGVSAGGGLTFSTILRLIDEGMGDKVKGVVAVVPVTVHPNAVPEELKGKYTSYDEHAEDTVNTKDSMLCFFDTYGAPPDDKYTSPLLHMKLGQIKKAYITECGADTLRDDARLMKEKLESQNVPVKYDDYPGFPHYSWSFPSKHLAGHAQEFFGNLIQGVNWVKEGSAAGKP